MELRGRTKIVVEDRKVDPSPSRCRIFLLPIQSSDRRLFRGAQMKTHLRYIHGVLEKFFKCDGPDGETALAFLLLLCPRRDPNRKTRIPDQVRTMDIFSSYNGMRRYTDVMSTSASSFLRFFHHTKIHSGGGGGGWRRAERPLCRAHHHGDGATPPHRRRRVDARAGFPAPSALLVLNLVHNARWAL